MYLFTGSRMDIWRYLIAIKRTYSRLTVSHPDALVADGIYVIIWISEQERLLFPSL